MKTLLIRSLTLFHLALILHSCGLKDDPLVGEWEYANYRDTGTKERSTDSELPYFESYFMFSQDGHFLLCDYGDDDALLLDDVILIKEPSEKRKKRIFYGEYKRQQDSIIFLKVHNYLLSDDIVLVEHSNDKKNLKFYIDLKQQKNRNNRLFNYKKNNSIDLNRTTYTFLSPELNKWRNPAQQKETKDEIRARVKNSLEYAAAYLKVYESQDKSASLIFLTNLPFKFGRNGIRMENNTDWESLFYDLTDAKTSYKILADAFKASADIPNDLSRNPIGISIFILTELNKNIE